MILISRSPGKPAFLTGRCLDPFRHHLVHPAGRHAPGPWHFGANFCSLHLVLATVSTVSTVCTVWSNLGELFD